MGSYSEKIFFYFCIYLPVVFGSFLHTYVSRSVQFFLANERSTRQLLLREEYLTHLSLVRRLYYGSPTCLLDFDTDELRKRGVRGFKRYC